MSKVIKHKQQYRKQVEKDLMAQSKEITDLTRKFQWAQICVEDREHTLIRIDSDLDEDAKQLDRLNEDSAIADDIFEDRLDFYSGATATEVHVALNWDTNEQWQNVLMVRLTVVALELSFYQWHAI